MRILHGMPISSGLATGEVAIIKNISYQTFPKNIKSSEVKKHISKFERSIKKSLNELQLLFSLLESNAKDEREIILSHQEMLKDKVFCDETISTIENELVSAEFAVHSYFEKLLKHFSKIEDDYLSQRKEDLIDIKNRIIRNLKPNSEEILRSITENKIIAIDETSV